MNFYYLKRFGLSLIVLFLVFVVSGYLGGNLGASQFGTNYSVPLYDLLIEGLAMVLLFVIYIVIKFVIFHARLHSCKASSDFSGPVFRFGSQTYERKKYVDMRREWYLVSPYRRLAKLKQNSFWGEKKNHEYASAEREALNSALEMVKDREQRVL